MIGNFDSCLYGQGQDVKPEPVASIIIRSQLAIMTQQHDQDRVGNFDTIAFTVDLDCNTD